MRKLSCASVLGLVISLAVIPFLLNPLFAKDLVIGINTPLSGAAAPTGLGLLRAMELAAEDINATGGIKVGKETYTLKLITYDNKYDAREAVASVNKLIFNDKVKYIVTTGGTCVIAVSPLITEPRRCRSLRSRSIVTRTSAASGSTPTVRPKASAGPRR